MKQFLLIAFIVLFKAVQAQKPYPVASVESVLKKAGRNRPELEKALAYFKMSESPLKLKAMEFLVAHMDGHYSEDYYWADTTGRRIYFNEQDYSDPETSAKVFEELKSKVKGIHAIPFIYRDIDTVKASFLIENTQLAFESWALSPCKNIPFNDFCQYILPYRVSTEPLQNWRKAYKEKFKWISDSARHMPFHTLVDITAIHLQSWFISTWGKVDSNRVLTNEGAMQLLFNKKGQCQDMTLLQTLVFRSQGIPASYNIIPYWATAWGRHFLNTVFDPQMQAIPLDAGRHSDALHARLDREPSKVLRLCYSSQAFAVASTQSAENIPPGILRKRNIQDITSTYWPVRDLHVKLFPINDNKSRKAWAAVFNSGKWNITWYGDIKNDSVCFKDMPMGAVFLPVYFAKGKLSSAGPPVASGADKQLILRADTLNKQTLIIHEQERFLVLRPGKKYMLFFWDNKWKLLGQKIAVGGESKLVFENAPRNALFLLVPEYSKGLERPFMFGKDGNRIWL